MPGTVPFGYAAICADCRIFFDVRERRTCPTCGTEHGWMLVPVSLLGKIEETEGPAVAAAGPKGGS